MNKLLFCCITSTQVVFSQSWDHFLCLTKQSISTSTIFELFDELWPDVQLLFYVLSYNPCSIVWRRLLFRLAEMSCPWVISFMMTMFPNLISLFHRDLFYVFGDVCLYSAVSRWVSSYVVASSLWHVEIGSLVMILLSSHIFILIGKYHVLSMYYDETIHNWQLWWLPSSVVCGILFRDINSCSNIWSPSMN